MNKNIIYTMGLIALSNANFLAAMQSGCNDKDSLARIKFQAMIQTCKQARRANTWDNIHIPDVEARKKCISEYYETFLKECAEEEAQKEKAKQNSKPRGRFVSNRPGPWGQR